jgi:hypothetical protein
MYTNQAWRSKTSTLAGERESGRRFTSLAYDMRHPPKSGAGVSYLGIYMHVEQDTPSLGNAFVLLL